SEGIRRVPVSAAGPPVAGSRDDALGDLRDSSTGERARPQRSARVPPLARRRTVGAPTPVHSPPDGVDAARLLSEAWRGVHRGAAGARSGAPSWRPSDAEVVALCPGAFLWK